MPFFSSARERRLWLWALAAVVAIYSTLGLAPRVVGALRASGWLEASFALGMFLVAAAVVVQGLRTRAGGVEIGVALGVVAAYFMHLKYDNAWFTKMLGAGLVLAYPVYMVMAYALGFLGGWSWVAKVALITVPTVVGAIWLLFAWKGGDAEHGEPTHDPGPDADDHAVTEATH